MMRPLLFAMLAAGTLVGCGDSGDKPPAYANVSGTVLYNGKPLEKGAIAFTMEGRPPSSMDIVDGKFNGQAMVGSNTVSLTARRKAPGARPLPPGAAKQIQGYAQKQQGAPTGDTSTEPTEEIIPPEWGTKSTQQRVVEAGAKNEFEFSIKGK